MKSLPGRGLAQEEIIEDSRARDWRELFLRDEPLFRFRDFCARS